MRPHMEDLQFHRRPAVSSETGCDLAQNLKRDHQQIVTLVSAAIWERLTGAAPLNDVASIAEPCGGGDVPNNQPVDLELGPRDFAHRAINFRTRGLRKPYLTSLRLPRRSEVKATSVDVVLRKDRLGMPSEYAIDPADRKTRPPLGSRHATAGLPALTRDPSALAPERLREKHPWRS